MAEVLRLELSPFGVKVLSVVTGAISTNCQTNFQDWALPADSPYKAIEETFAKFVRATDGMVRTPLAAYATEVVDNILGGITGQIWVGERAERMKNASFGGELAVLRVRCVFPKLNKVLSDYPIGPVSYERIRFG
jgi:NAD(P)-dependent dehydrogenase (short-subunit alcohol dehydrogenase family)